MVAPDTSAGGASAARAADDRWPVTNDGNVSRTQPKHASPGQLVIEVSRCAATVATVMVSPAGQRFDPSDVTCTVAPGEVSTP